MRTSTGDLEVSHASEHERAQHALDWSAGGVSRAAVATLRHVAHEEHVAKRNGVAHPVPVRGARVTASVVAPEAGVRGRTVRHQCGGRIWRSTVVVYVFLPRLRFSASLSSQIFFVSRFAHGYRVWERIH